MPTQQQPSQPRPSQQRQGDVFPATMNSWIDGRLLDGVRGRQEVNRHVMDVYAFPLKVYFMGTRDRWLGEPEDVVQGFFASRLSKGEFFQNWRASGLRLRHWLINGFCFYLKELRRAKKRALPNTSSYSDPEDDDPGPRQAFDRAYIVSLVREALKRSQNVCELEGLGVHFEVFVRHFYQGQAYGDFAKDLGVDAARAAVMARTARSKFQATLRGMINQDGTGSDIDEEIRALLEGD